MVTKQKINKIKNFAMTGVAGYIAPRHLKAIKDTGNELIASFDPHDSVGILDSYFPATKFFTEFERFERYVEKLRAEKSKDQIDYVTICSPNYLHDAHIRFALRNQADAICEKPLVINPWNIDALKKIEQETGKKIYTILQLRVHPLLIKLKNDIEKKKSAKKADIVLSYVTSRGPWYHISWKGNLERSGGLVTNIGIHFFDLLLWLFGEVQKNELHINEQNKIGGFIELKGARVQWFLSIDSNDLPKEIQKKGQRTFRSLTINNDEIEFSAGFTDLHTEVYRKTLAGNGFGLDDARPSIELVHQIRNSKPKGKNNNAHPFVL